MVGQREPNCLKGLSLESVDWGEIRPVSCHGEVMAFASRERIAQCVLVRAPKHSKRIGQRRYLKAPR
eukprot:6208567-Pleurochrysis_carterae.AAC.7